MELVPYVVVLLLLAASIVISASETALFSLPQARIRAFAASPDPRKTLIARLLDRPRDLLVTIFLLNNLSNILIQNVISSTAGPAAGWMLKVVVPFALVLVIGEIIPKVIGLQKNVSMALFTAPFTNLLHKLCAPVRKALVNATAPLVNALFFFLKPDPEISHEELKHVLKQSEAHGILNPGEAELVRGFLELQDTTVKEAMRPRDEMLSYDIKEPLTKLVHLFADKEVTRVPVIEGNSDNLLGIITAEAFFLNQPSLKLPDDLKPHLIKPEFVPESTPARVLLLRMEEKDLEMAIVIDEYGSIAGLITFEDLVEILIGEITDQRDTDALFTRSSDTEIIANGKMELAEINALFDIDLTSDTNAVTIGGWLTEQVGTIPKSGLKCEYEGLFFHVLAAEKTHVKKLYIRKL